MMKRFEEPDFEVIVLNNIDCLSNSDEPCEGYACGLYGDICEGHQVN